MISMIKEIRAQLVAVAIALVVLPGAAPLPRSAPLPARDDDASSWASFVEAAGERHGDFGRRAAAFLADHRPERDADLPAELLIENLDLALAARAEFPWAAGVPDRIFLNDVLPYAVLGETRDRWRPRLLELGREIVAECSTAAEAAQALNRELFDRIGVHYDTGRRRPDQNLSESMEQGRASCTGLSIILVEACRAVGVPARVAGVASWTAKRGNHTWVEIWDGAWHFAGADEHDAGGLDRAWFVADASKAIPGDPRHAVWATSWERTGDHFPMVWARSARDVPGIDVTHRYVRAARAGLATCHVRAWGSRDGSRVVVDVEAIDPDGASAGRVTTRAGRADLNDMPALSLVPGVTYRLRVDREGAARALVHTAREGDETLDVAWDELGLGRDEAERLVASTWERAAASIAAERQGELADAAVAIGDHRLRLLEKVFGDAPPGGRSLWISLHGGGGAPERVNDRQWSNQIRLYEPAEGIVVAPRAPSDAWNMWHQAHVDGLFDRLIETYVAARGVDPDRVYLLGYSAGGDGVYQVAPRMADRFAAASMMAGHPNEASPLGLRNLPFAIFVGAEDAAYRRNEVAAEWGRALEELRAGDPAGYPHRTTIYPGDGHWMGGKDAEALPWMAAHARDPWPSRVVWRQDDVVHDRFYWLSNPGRPEAGDTIVAWVSGQVVHVETRDVSSLTLRLRDALVDLDAPITVEVNGRPVFAGLVARSEAAVAESLRGRGDPRSAATALLPLSWSDGTGAGESR